MTPPPRIAVSVAGHGLRPWLAATSAACERGLMFLRSIPPDGGMLFCYPEPAPLWLWMRNTSVPLSAAFLGADRRVVGLVDLDPFSELRRRSPALAQYALETRRGWFAERRIAVGDQVAFDVPTLKPGPLAQR